LFLLFVHALGVVYYLTKIKIGVNHQVMNRN